MMKIMGRLLSSISVLSVFRPKIANFFKAPELQAPFPLEFSNYMQYGETRVTGILEGGKCLTTLRF